MNKLNANSLLILALLTPWLCSGQTQPGPRAPGPSNDSLKPAFYPIPLQPYAIADVSGDLNPSYIGEVALDDSSNVFFSYGDTETGGANVTVVKHWNGGVMAPAEPISTFQTIPSKFVQTTAADGTPTDVILLGAPPAVSYLRTDGQMFGNLEEDFYTRVVDPGNGQVHYWLSTIQESGYVASGGTVSRVGAQVPPFFSEPPYNGVEPFTHRPPVTDVDTFSPTSKSFAGLVEGYFSDNGVISSVTYGSEVVYTSVDGDQNAISHVTVFCSQLTPPNTSGSPTPSLDLKVVNEQFAPYPSVGSVNSSGWAIGYSSEGWRLWNGTVLSPMEGQGYAINEANDIIVGGTYNEETQLITGSHVLERGGTKVLINDESGASSLIPSQFRKQLRNVVPWFLSSRREDPPSGTVVPLLHIGFYAETKRVNSGTEWWEWAYFISREFNDGTTDLREIPSSIWFHYPISMINASGIIATQGDPEGDFGTGAVDHALLLIPVEINCNEVYTFSGHPNDVLSLCKVISDIKCEWKLKNPGPVIGTFSQGNRLNCNFVPSAPGSNVIQLFVGGQLAWQKSIQVLDLKGRSTWSAQPIIAAHMDGTIPLPVEGVTFHHSGNTGDGVSELQRIQKEHQLLWPYYLWHKENFGDIAYHFVLTKNGALYVGRELEASPGSPGGPYTKGADVKKKNTLAGIAICVLGNYDSEAFSAAHQTDLEKALTAICRRYRVTGDRVSYHAQQAAKPPVVETTHCPGANIIPKAAEIRQHVQANLQ